MGSKGEFGKWMGVTLEAYWSGVADLAHNLYARAGLADSEAVTAEYLLITYGMEFRKACAELKLVTIYVEGAVGSLLSLNGILRKTVCIYGEEITHAGTLEFQIAGNAVKTHNVNYVLLNRAEYPLKHIIEVNANVGGNAAALVNVSLPGGVIPFASGSYVGKVYIINFIFRAVVYLLLKSNNTIVKPELQYGIGLMAGLVLQLQKVIYVVRVEYQRFFTDDVTAQP